MEGGVEARHDRGMGRLRQGRDGGGLREEHAPLRQGVEGRGAGLRVAVAPQVIGPGRIEGDEDDVRLGHPPLGPVRGQRLARRPAAVAGEPTGQRRGQPDRDHGDEHAQATS